MNLHAIIREARPRQWVKNSLVVAAPGAAGVLGDGGRAAATLVVFLAFCMVSSGTYYWNDILDVEADRRHPTKRNRPIAAGTIPIGAARLIGTALLAGGLALGLGTGRWQTSAVLAAYVATTLAYSKVFKHVPVIDLVLVASGFVLRAIGGAVGADVPMSEWFVLVTVFASLFIVTGKRFAELREVGSGSTRSTLDQYSLDYLRQVLSVSLGVTLVAYCLWAFERAGENPSAFHFYELTVVPMTMALLRYLLVLEQGHGGAPEDVFFRDRTLQVLGLVWAIVFALGVYT
ncbi:MAG: decaprenyl-phosphate phosphoribosyltransferase [Ilumatobacteraceae bacterium]